MKIKLDPFVSHVVICVLLLTATAFCAKHSQAATTKTYAGYCAVGGDLTNLKRIKEGRYYPTTLITTNTKACPVIVAPPVVVPPIEVPPTVPPVVVVPPVVTPPVDMSNMPHPNLALIPAKSIGYDTLRIRIVTEQPGVSNDQGAFRVSCDYSHMLNDDPIVFPNQQGRSHLHTFFGNTGAYANSTSESIRTTGNSTCNGGLMNRTAYWAPAMIDTFFNAPLRPRNALMYYKHATVGEIPRGLRMIAGNMASSAPQDHEWFECNEQYTSRQPYLVSCGKGGLVSQSVTFPDCWNGKDLDSADHKSHMAYSTNGVCAVTHPKKIPTLSMLIYYPVTTDAGTANWRLSSDNYPKFGQNAGYSSHADFMMGWDEAIHKSWVDGCINRKLDCHAHLLGDGRAFY